MAEYVLDDVDKQLLYYLQQDARYTAIEIADRIGVSDNTIHNRMEKLEEAGIITGYTTSIDLKKVDLSLYFLFVCTSRISDRSTVADNALALPQVIEVTELMTGQRNLHIKAVGDEDRDITHVAQQLDNLNLEVNDELLIRAKHETPIDLTSLDEIIFDEA